MIERIVLGKRFPRFSVHVTEDLITGFREVFLPGQSDPEVPASLPFTWPMILTAHGTACLIPVWEEIGVDPLHMRLVAEEFYYNRQPSPGEKLTGQARVADMDEIVTPERGIEQQIDLAIDFRDASGDRVASYTCSYRLVVAGPRGTGSP